jgi:hypothetical protein
MHVMMGSEQYATNKKKITKEYDHLGPRVRDTDHGVLCMKSDCDSRVRLSILRSGTCCSAPNRATCSERPMTYISMKDKANIQLHR